MSETLEMRVYKLLATSETMSMQELKRNMKGVTANSIWQTCVRLRRKGKLVRIGNKHDRHNGVYMLALGAEPPVDGRCWHGSNTPKPKSPHIGTTPLEQFWGWGCERKA